MFHFQNTPAPLPRLFFFLIYFILNSICTPPLKLLASLSPLCHLPLDQPAISLHNTLPILTPVMLFTPILLIESCVLQSLELTLGGVGERSGAGGFQFLTTSTEIIS